MAHIRTTVHFAALALLSVITLPAQREPRIVSPELHSDRTVTFRLRGPEVRQAILNASWFGDPTPLVKGEDGVWTVTIGPVKPGILSYTYTVDGVRNIDPHNPRVKLWMGGATSLVEVPAENPAFYDLRDVPHGDLHIHYYASKSVGKTRRAHVYVPPGYALDTDATYPTLYLLHGSGDNDSTWTEIGRVHLILDNLIAAGKVKPMVVVMPDGHPVPWGQRSAGRNELFRKDLVEDLLPLIESRYRVKRDRAARAVAGLSMGGGQAVHVGLGRTDLFRYVGAFSASVRGASTDATIQAFVADPDKANHDLALFWIAIGKDDFLLKGQQEFDTLLTGKGIDHTFQVTEGDHSWPVWRRYFRDFSPLLFVDK